MYGTQMGDAALSPERSTLGRADIASALTMGTIALLVIGLQPILLGAMVEVHSASVEGVASSPWKRSSRSVLVSY